MPGRPIGVVGSSGGSVVQGPPNLHQALTFDSNKVYNAIRLRAEAVVRRAGQMAVGSARERAPVRKVFAGGRRGKPPRFYSLNEAKMELPAYLRGMRESGTGRGGPGEMTKAEALAILRKTPIATSRNKANLWQRTEVDRRVEETPTGWRLKNRNAEFGLTTRGTWELRDGRAISRTQVSTAGTSVIVNPYTGERKTVKRRYGQFERETEKAHLGGSLRKSIHTADRSEGTTRKVSIVAGGDSAPYARFVEFGTRHAAAQPYLRPALKHVEGPFKAMMRDAFRGVGK